MKAIYFPSRKEELLKLLEELKDVVLASRSLLEGEHYRDASETVKSLIETIEEREVEEVVLGDQYE